jgi:CHAT domain-containing protein
MGCAKKQDPQSANDQIVREIRQGDYKAAMEAVNHALEQQGDSSGIWAWRFRVWKAYILSAQAAPKGALDLLQTEIPASLATSDVAVRFNLARGIAHRLLQDFDSSQKDFAAAERAARDSQPELLCEVFNAKGALQLDEKKFSEAEANFQQALSYAREHKRVDQQAYASGNLANVAVHEEHFDQAIDRGQEAMHLSGSLGMNAVVATIQGNLGWSYLELGDFDNALDFYKQGAEASGKSGLSGYSAYWFTGVAESYMALHEYALAENLARTTLDQARQLKNAQTTALSLNMLTKIMLRTGRLGEAEQFNEEALKMEDKFGTLYALLFAGEIATANEHFSEAEKLYHRVLVEPNTETPVKWEAEAGLARMWDGEGRYVEAERQFLKAINAIEQARQSINHDELRLSFLSSGIEVYGEYIDFLIRRDRPADALKQAELSRARTLAEGLSANGQAARHAAASRPSLSVTPQQLAQRLRATLLFYWLGQEQSYLWVITPAKTTYFHLPKAGDIEPVVKSYRKAILGMRDAQDAGSADGEKLFAMLVEPAKKLVPKGSRVILLPAESLYGLNLETLVVPDPQPHFWIEDVTLTTANSLTLLASSANHPTTREKNLLLVGNTQQPNPDFPPLAQAPAEMRSIEHYFPEPARKVLEGKQATTAAYLSSSPERFAYLHFVTHGTASRTRPLESAVILSPDGDSYKLYAREIIQHRLKASLVTISACNGSGTRAYSGEGLVGLSWAFLRAGAHNVIGALWEVSDASTPQLMDVLYGELSLGKDPATALRDAKLSLLHSSDANSVFKKPFYWAPFQLYAGS